MPPVAVPLHLSLTTGPGPLPDSNILITMTTGVGWGGVSPNRALTEREHRGTCLLESHFLLLQETGCQGLRQEK